MKIEPKIDFRIQGLSCAEVEQDEEKSRKQFIERLGSATTKQKKNALIAELQSKHPKTPLSDYEKEMIHTLRNVQGFGLYEISLKIQCPPQNRIAK